MAYFAGWQPRAPVSIQKLFTQELTRSAKLLQSFAVEGVSLIDEDDIVRDFGEPSSEERILEANAQGGASSASLDFGTLLEGSTLLHSASGDASFVMGGGDAGAGLEGPSSRPDSAGGNDYDGEDQELAHIAEGGAEVSVMLDDVPVIEPADDGIVRRTKKQFKAEYLRRKLYRDDVVAKIIERERRIAKTSKALDQLLTEAFFLSIYDAATQLTRILPVLGVSYPAKNKNQLLQVLLHFTLLFVFNNKAA